MTLYNEKSDLNLKLIDEVLNMHTKEHGVNIFKRFVEKYCINDILDLEDDGEFDIDFCHEDGDCGYKVLFVIVDEKDERKTVKLYESVQKEPFFINNGISIVLRYKNPPWEMYA